VLSRKLGAELTVYPVGLGCMGMSNVYGGQDEGEAIKTLRHAVELGVNFFDTAEAYGPYTNEILLGKALAPVRGQVTIATKFGFQIVDRGNGPEETDELDSRPAHVRAVAEASLKRLNVDVIDLFYQHRVDPKVPIEETVGAMADLVREGKIRAIGLSEASAATIRRAHKVHPVTAVQSEYSLWSREPESQVLAACRELGIGFVPFSPLGRGLLTGTLKSLGTLAPGDFRRTLPRFDQENFDRNVVAVAELQRLAAEKGVTAAQLALAWVLHQGDFIVPIPGARKIANLAQNAAAAGIALSRSEVDAMRQLLSPDKVAGGRYSADQMAKVDR
jgi:aryl-alcohol dehydrogenase-like predicted oxidoreductase